MYYWRKKKMMFVERALAEEIFKRLYEMSKFDGHSVGVGKNQILELAKEYGVELEEGNRLEKNVAHDICRLLASNQKEYEQKNEYKKAAVVWDLLRLIVKKYDITDWEDLI
jgi:hypothetical protein